MLTAAAAVIGGGAGGTGPLAIAGGRRTDAIGRALHLAEDPLVATITA